MYVPGARAVSIAVSRMPSAAAAAFADSGK
jgi:hypothetical protein